MSDFYWELIQHDGTKLEIPPAAVETVKRRWDQGQPIHTSSMTIPAHQIKTFRQTSKPYGAVPLLEAAAQAFHEPVLTEDGSIVAKWVKKPVSQTEYNKHYGVIPAYRKLDQNDGMITVAFRQPVHEINHQLVTECTDDEILRLTQR